MVPGSPWGKCGCTPDPGPHVLLDGGRAVQACLARGLADQRSGQGGYTAAQEGFFLWWFLPEPSLVLTSSSVKGESHGTHHMGLWGE